MSITWGGTQLRLYEEPRAEAAPRPVAFWPWLIVAFLILGVALRLGCYFRNHSLWIDEAMLALNVVHRPIVSLGEPLDLNQGAPLGFLILSKYSVLAFGHSELALRSIPLLSGIVGLLLFVPLAYRLLPIPAARLAIAFHACSPYLVGYCAEFKQYELDATITIGLLYLNWKLLERFKWSRFLLAMLAGVLAVWCSHPALFNLCAGGVVLLADALRRGDRTAFKWRLVLVSAWAGSFLAAYGLFLRKLGLNEYLLNYWSGKFCPMPPTSLGDCAWVVHHLLEFFDKPLGFGTTEFPLAGLAAFCAGCALLQLSRHHWRLIGLLAGPLVLALMASAFKKYPFAGRLLLFAAPLGLLLISYGAMELARVLNLRFRGAGYLLIAMLFLAPVVHCKDLMKRPLHAEQTREMLAFVHSNWRENDRLYIYYGAVPAASHYSGRYPFPLEAVRMGKENRNGPLSVFHEELGSARGPGRLWVILAHRQPREEAAIQAYLQTFGPVEQVYQGMDAVVLCQGPRATVSVVAGDN